MHRYVWSALLVAAFLPFLSKGDELSLICPSTTGVIDANFPKCRSPEITLAGPRDYKQYAFVFGQDQDVNARVMVRAIVGTVTVDICTESGDCLQTQDTSEGPAVSKLLEQDVSLDYQWILTVSNTYGMPSKFVVEVDVTNSTLTANNATKTALSAMFKDCCDASADYSRLQIPGTTFLSSCEYLRKWSTAAPDAPEDDVCQDANQHCNSDGSLDTLSLSGFAVPNPSGVISIIPQFKESCLLKPPSGLPDLVDLTHLEFSKCGLRWQVPDIVNVTSKMFKLERLYFPWNAITGQLDDAACDMFKGTLKSLSFRNSIPSPDQVVKPPWNAISGEISSCVFASSLENLILVANQISSIAPIPSGIPSAIRLMRLASQTNPDTGKNTLEGTGIPKGFNNLKLLSFLGLSGNKLGGKLDFTPPAALEWLDLSGNELEGSIPDFKSFSTLNTLVLQDNPGLTGDITKIGVTEMPNLAVFEISNTSVGGNPNEVDWTKLPNLKWWSVSDAELEGEVPASLAKLPYLQAVVISDNTGIISQQAFGDALPATNEITVYDVSSCSITDLPDGLKNLDFFKADPISLYSNGWQFDISGNDIVAAMPSWLANPMQNPNNAIDPREEPPLYFFAIQVDMEGFEEGNRIGCPHLPLGAEAVRDAQALRGINPAVYDQLVNCFNGTQQVPVAKYLTWLSLNGPMPAPPPAARSGAPIRSSKSSSSGSSKSGPSAGTVAGIVIGVLLGVAFLAALIFVVVKYIIPKAKGRSFSKFKEADTVPLGQSNPYGDPNQFQMAVQQPPQGANAV